MIIAPYSSKQNTIQFFTGAKEIKLLDKYTKEGIKKFDWKNATSDGLI